MIPWWIHGCYSCHSFDFIVVLGKMVTLSFSRLRAGKGSESLEKIGVDGKLYIFAVLVSCSLLPGLKESIQ